MVPSVQTKRDTGRVGLRQEGLDLRLVLHVRLSMWMKDDRQAKTVTGDVGHFVRGVDQSLPGIVRQLTGRQQLTAKEVGVGIIDEHEILGAQCGQVLTSAYHLL